MRHAARTPPPPPRKGFYGKCYAPCLEVKWWVWATLVRAGVGWVGGSRRPLHKEPRTPTGSASISGGSQRFDPTLKMFRESSEALRPVRNATRAGLKHN